MVIRSLGGGSAAQTRAGSRNGAAEATVDWIKLRRVSFCLVITGKLFPIHAPFSTRNRLGWLGGKEAAKEELWIEPLVSVARGWLLLDREQICVPAPIYICLRRVAVEKANIISGVVEEPRGPGEGQKRVMP